MTPRGLAAILCALTLALASSGRAQDTEKYDVLIRNGIVYDGSGRPPQNVDIGIRGDRISAIGDLPTAAGTKTIDATEMAVAPGFINMLSWSTASLLVDGRSQSDIRQGVTLEIFGEGWSMGPLSDTMRRQLIEEQGDLRYEVPWTTLAEYLEHMVSRGVSPNVASFVGATTLRIHEMGYADRPPTGEELERMKQLVRDEMEHGALGIGSSLIYAPAAYSKTDELVELCKVASQYDGIYISHLRSEGDRLLEAIDELIEIARRANIAAEIYHLKVAGENNWTKFPDVVNKIEQARAEGLRITADMYTYTAGATGLSASMPPWVQEGGYDRWSQRLRDPAIRAQVSDEMRKPANDWENLLLMAGSPERVLLVGFKNPDLKHLTGKSLADVAKQRGQSAEETAMDLVIEDGSRVECVYFLMSEENVAKTIALPWVSFGSDAASLAPEGPFLKSNPHPRAYGCFARLLGRYVRDEQVVPLEAAIQRLTALPARNLGLRGRGELKKDYFADIFIFDPKAIADTATYEQPHSYATGVRDVLVNGTVVLHNGEHTDARPGRVVHGPGRWRSADLHDTLIEVTETALQVHRQSYVWDGHNDLPWTMRTEASSSFEQMDISKSQPKLNTDIGRLREGNVGAQFWSVYVPAETAKQGTALQQTLEQIQLVHTMVERYPDVFELALTSDDVERIQKSGKIASLIGVEGGHSIENSLANLRRLYELGARYMTLTHSDTLEWADAATDDPLSQGLSPLGEEIVREMNRLGMIVDLSHVSPETMHDVLRISNSPVMFSHSSARTVADHPRNVPDDILLKVADNGGIVMVNFFSGFVVPSSAKTMQTMFQVNRELRAKYPNDAEFKQAQRRWELEHPIDAGVARQVVDHIDHIVRVAGIDHVGLGSDFDGVGKLPWQLEDVSKYPVITQELLNRGYTPAEIHQVLSGNMMRVMRQAEMVSKQAQ